MIHSLKKILSLTLVAAFLLGLFPALDTPARAAVEGSGTAVATGLEVTGGADGDWILSAGSITGATVASASALTLKNNTSGAKKLSFTYAVK